MRFSVSVFLGLAVFAAAHPAKPNSDSFEHPKIDIQQKLRRKRGLLLFDSPRQEQHPDFWNNNAETTLREQLNKNYLNKNMAKNVIFFLGDGMGLATQMASRMYKGGEEEQLSFEKFPYSGMSKTYCVNTQVADSACSATAYLSGVKGNYGTIGLSASANQGDCKSQNNTANHVDSIFKLAQDYGMRTGLITNTRITHATPAGVYAHVAERYWENDAKLKREGGDVETCPDVAYQLVHGHVGNRLNVIMGGGWMEFLTENEKDIDGGFGLRTDTNLIKEWKRIHHKKKHAYVETKKELQDLGNDVERLLAIFATDHLPYHVEDEAKLKPTLSEMVEKALDILDSANDDKGYLLFVEGGRIDHGHHYGMAKKALSETIELEKAVEMARRRTSEENTLIVVTADHSHSFTVSGYAVSLNLSQQKHIFYACSEF